MTTTIIVLGATLRGLLLCNLHKVYGRFACLNFVIQPLHLKQQDIYFEATQLVPEKEFTLNIGCHWKAQELENTMGSLTGSISGQVMNQRSQKEAYFYF